MFSLKQNLISCVCLSYRIMTQTIQTNKKRLFDQYQAYMILFLLLIFYQSKVIRKKIILYGGNFNTTSLYNQKVDVHHVNRSKAEELGARRLQRPKIFQLGKKFFLVFSMNQAILIHLPKFCFLAFFGLVAFIKAKRPKFFTVCQITFYFPSNKQIKI